LISMPAVTPFHDQPSVSDLESLELDSVPVTDIVAVDAEWRRLLTQAEMAAPRLRLAAIEGESGSGKRTLARLIHGRSAFAKTSFQRHDARQWLVTEQDPAMLTGFLYLDRVDLLAAPGQALLLGILKGLQANRCGRAVLVASSQTSLRQMAGQGMLLPDLAFRLISVRFAIPPLRQRREDIAPLTQTLLDRICARYQHRPVALGPGAMARLLHYNWPGNIRELSSVLESSLLQASNGILRAEALPIPSDVAATQRNAEATPQIQPGPPIESLDLGAVIQRHVRYVLDLNRGNKQRTARQLGISRSTLYRILGNKPILAL
jgi:DNA-binding NtrC family response regulator